MDNSGGIFPLSCFINAMIIFPEDSVGGVWKWLLNSISFWAWLWFSGIKILLVYKITYYSVKLPKWHLWWYVNACVASSLFKINMCIFFYIYFLPYSYVCVCDLEMSMWQHVPSCTYNFKRKQWTIFTSTYDNPNLKWTPDKKTSVKGNFTYLNLRQFPN